MIYLYFLKCKFDFEYTFLYSKLSICVVLRCTCGIQATWASLLLCFVFALSRNLGVLQHRRRIAAIDVQAVFDIELLRNSSCSSSSCGPGRRMRNGYILRDEAGSHRCRVSAERARRAVRSPRCCCNRPHRASAPQTGVQRKRNSCGETSSPIRTISVYVLPSAWLWDLWRCR